MVHLLMHISQGIQHKDGNQLLVECHSLPSNRVVEDVGDN